MDVEDRYLVGGAYAGITAEAPEHISLLRDIVAKFDSGTHQYNLSVHFSGATSYSIAPAVETGWDFNTSTAVLEIDTDDAGVFGPYTVTATNANGSTDGNTFTVKVAEANAALYVSSYFSFRIGF